MNLKNKTCVVFESYYSTLGGNQKYLNLLSKEVPKHGYSLKFIIPGKGKLYDLLLKSDADVEVVAQNIALNKYRNTFFSSPMAVIVRLFYVFLYNLKLIFFLKKIRPGAVLCCNIRSFFMVFLAAKILRVPILWYIKSQLNNPFLDKLGFLLSTKVLFISHQLYSTSKEMMPLDKSVYIPIGVNFSDLDKAFNRKRCADIPDYSDISVKLVFIGTISKSKGFDILLTSLSNVKELGYDVNLYVVGDFYDSDFKKDTLSYVDDNLTGNVKFLGWRSDVYEILCCMDIFVLPSLSEGIPRSIIESIYIGTPVITTNAGGILEIFENSNTDLIVNPGDFVDLSLKIVRCIDNYEFYKNDVISKKDSIKNKYSIGNNAAKIKNILKEIE
jgi:L-malate glycosyltransferase